VRRLAHSLRRFLHADDGPTAVEYAVMLALIVVVCVATIGTLGLNTQAVCNTICAVIGK
jgi:pilus assembly protein Flp/PilA